MATDRLSPVHLEGWNRVPRGGVATFDWGRAPLWIKVVRRIPIVDRFCYPVMVRRSLGSLTPCGPDPLDEPAARRLGWRITSAEEIQPGSRASLGTRQGEAPAR
jgi:hypothetical protein